MAGDGQVDGGKDILPADGPFETGPDTPRPGEVVETADHADGPCVPACDECGNDDGCGGKCIDDALCDDENPCTHDECDGEGCVFDALQAECDDDDKCTFDDTCLDGVCTGAPVDCSNLTTEVCTGVCHPETGDCIAEPVGDGEEVCDGIDNDCDNEVDEDLDSFDCLLLNQFGACPGVELCVEGEWECVGDAPAEETCDGEDNDCDGEIDEGLNPNACGTCGPAPIEICDNLDNDCDGEVDEGLNEPGVWKEQNACMAKGVCDSPQLDAECKNGKWFCNYDSIETYVADEAQAKLCDGLDNDCDGITDELCCDMCEPCKNNGQCQSGACRQVPFVMGSEKFCAPDKNVCVLYSAGECEFVPQGDKACGTEIQPCQCGVNGLWFCDLEQCKGEDPECTGGECKMCKPADAKCFGNTILGCNADETGWDEIGECGDGEVCACDGQCLPNSEFKVNLKTVAKAASTAVRPRAAPRAGCGFIAVYQSDGVLGASGTEIVATLVGGDFKPDKPEFIVNSKLMSGNQQDPDVAAVPTEKGGFIVVWQDDGAYYDDGWGISGQLINSDGMLVGEKLQINSVVEGDQTRPRVAAIYHQESQKPRFVVVWEHDVPGNPDSPDIMGRLFGITDAGVQPLTDDTQMASFPAGVQKWSALTNRANEGFVTTWVSNANNEWELVFRLFGTSMEPIGISQDVNSATAPENPALAGFAGDLTGDFVVAWDSYGLDGSNSGVFMQLPDNNGDPVAVNDVTSGHQRKPIIGTLADNRIVVTWESENLDGLGDNDGLAVAARLFEKDGSALNDSEFLVNQTAEGDQSNPALIVLQNNTFVVVWSHAVIFPPPTPATHDIHARVFGEPQ